jgi:hypothetical protein
VPTVKNLLVLGQPRKVIDLICFDIIIVLGMPSDIRKFR